MGTIIFVTALGWGIVLTAFPMILLSALYHNMRRIAKRLYKQGYSLLQIANMIGVSREQVCKLLNLPY